VPAGQTLGEATGDYALLTLHRPANVDHREVLVPLLEAMNEISHRLPVVFPMHPRTRGKIEHFGLQGLLQDLRVLPPAGYLEMLGLMKSARLVMTDSGGIQEETTALGVPCLTLRENTERPITIDQGTNTLIGTDRAALLQAAGDVLETGGKAGRVPEYWDGHAAERIAQVMKAWLAGAADRKVA
jgi:UDP-N-acetylglucosamine 2-epimerase (non-hydrolysing)